MPLVVVHSKWAYSSTRLRVEEVSPVEDAAEDSNRDVL
ncbi:hypothetical protein BSU04_12960 [Caballeronia sordidicola]|uniref:Uncharacterized protein n=1 Tax=Caballeronia sordidicola TaxID=196367 RepID=A0A226X429_CABSO|nr:hypothetical protein BSU04_12960 [Caballeronia sordidicola]